MFIFGVPLWLIVLTVVMASLVWYAWNMSKDLNRFDRLGITGPPPFPLVGNLGIRYWWDGMFKSQVNVYKQFKDRKLYGTFDANIPVLHIKDCDMIRDVLVTHFDHFSDRPNRFRRDPLMDKCTHYLKHNEWKNTRGIINSAINSKSFLQHTATAIHRACDGLVNFLKPKIDWRRKVELSGLALLYSVDVQSGVAFGGDFKTFNNIYGKNVDNLERLLKQSRRWRLASVFFQFMFSILRVFRISVVPKSALRYLNKQVDTTLEECETEGEQSESRQCLLGSMVTMATTTTTTTTTTTSEIESERFADSNGNNNGESRKVDPLARVELSRSDFQAQTFTFVHSGLEKVSSILSLVLFHLANNPSVCEKVQKEIDDIIRAQTPCEANVEKLQYLDQCINETIRMIPPYIAIERICTKDITIQGIRIPKNMVVRIPVYALHHDPDIWENPDEFNPDRFGPSESTTTTPRHPFAFLPFGAGPRNCLGMRVALLELKTVLVSMLRVMTPIPCGQTVYPVKLKKWKMEPEEDLWIKVRPRFWLGVCEYPPSSILA